MIKKYIQYGIILGGIILGLFYIYIIGNPFDSTSALRKEQNQLKKRLWPLLKIEDLMSNPRPPFQEKILYEAYFDSYYFQEIEINSTPTRRMRIVLTIPHDSQRRYSGIVCLAGHNSDLYSAHGGKETTLWNNIYQGFATRLTLAGYITISTQVSQHSLYDDNRTLIGERLWDVIRCTDYLLSLPQIDPEHIGIAGHSLGGEMAMWGGVMDTRISAVAVSGFLTTTCDMTTHR